MRCGLWVHSHNSRRCHKPDFCPLCLWNDILKVLAEAFGSGSGTFYGASAWWFITISWTTNPRNAKCVSGDYDPEDNKPPKGDRGYDPYPVVLGSDDYDSDMGWVGYQDARVLGLMMQEAVSDLYHQHIDGYHHKLEGVYRLHPGGANRVNLHCHTVANGREQDGDFIAQVLRQSITGKLSRCKDRLNRRYHVDLQVKAITTPEHLEHAVVYSEKVVPIRHMVADAMSRPEAKLPDGSWSPDYVDGLQTSLIHLIEDNIPNIFNGARLEPELPSLFRRKTVGNMVFTDKGTCIGDEPDWHKLARRRHAKKQREQRREKQKKKKEEEAKLRKQGKPVPAPKWYLRRRKHPRRLSCSLWVRARGQGVRCGTWAGVSSVAQYPTNRWASCASHCSGNRSRSEAAVRLNRAVCAERRVDFRSGNLFADSLPEAEPLCVR